MTSLYGSERQRAIRYVGFAKHTQAKISWRLLLLAHSLEKGLSVPERHDDFGVKKAEDLIGLMARYSNKNDFAYSEALSVLKKYKNFRKSLNLDISFLEPLKSEVAVVLPHAGIYELSAEDVKCNSEDFSTLCDKRHSVREFGDIYISREQIIAAIDTAKKAPSACNRQMVKVYFSMDPDKNLQIAELVPGDRGSQQEKAIYLIVCADMEAFDYYEINQWYVNGGIFLAYLQLALTSNNIGSCIYQWPADKELTIKLRSLLQIKENYAIISVLSAGNYREKFNVIQSSRTETSEYYSCV